MPRYTKKGQIQIAEIIVVIFIFIIIFTFGMYAYMNYLGGQEEIQTSQSQKLQLVEKMREVINFADIQCSIGGKSDQACVDIYRIQAFQRVLNRERQEAFGDYYEERFSGYSLNVHVVYPSGSSYGGSAVFNFIPPDTVTKDTMIIPVSVYDPLTERKYFGFLELVQYLGDKTRTGGSP